VRGCSLAVIVDSLPPYLDPVKGLCQLEALPFGKRLMPFPDEVEPFGGKLTNLAVVTAQSCHLHLKGVSNITEVVRLFSPPQENLLNLVRHNPLLHQIRIGQPVPGVGEDRVEHNPAGDTVIPVPDIAAVRVTGDYYFRSVYPEQTDDFLAELRRVLQSLVLMS